MFEQDEDKVFLSSSTNKKPTIKVWELFKGEVVNNDQLSYDMTKTQSKNTRKCQFYKLPRDNGGTSLECLFMAVKWRFFLDLTMASFYHLI